LTAQHLELVPQHDQLDVLQAQAAATANERAEQSPEREVEEGENHAADPPRPHQSSATRLLAPFRVGCFPDLYAALASDPPDQVITL
jgi:hypothetical protein